MPRPPRKTPPAGDTAQAAGRTIHSYQLGLLPVVNRLLTRLRLEHFLRDYLPPEDRRARLAPAQALMVLLKNLLLSREPLYGAAAWAARYDPHGPGAHSPTDRRAQRRSRRTRPRPTLPRRL